MCVYNLQTAFDSVEYAVLMDKAFLQASGVGLSINNFYAGGFHHAEDARTLGTSKESLEAQVAIAKEFAERIEHFEAECW